MPSKPPPSAAAPAAAPGKGRGEGKTRGTIGPTGQGMQGMVNAARAVEGADRRLTDQQQRLVDTIADAAAEGLTLANYEAARMAGYSGTDDVLRVTAAATLKKPHVRAALIAALRERMTSVLAPVALKRIAQLTGSADKDSVSLAAADRILTGAGIIGQAGDGLPGGGAILIQINASGFTGGAYSVQLGQRIAQAQQSQGLAAGEHSLAEVEGGQEGGEGGAD